MEGLLRVVTATPASTRSHASRARLLCGSLRWETRGGERGVGGAVVDLAFTFVFEGAEQISSSTAKRRHSVSEMQRAEVPGERRENASSAPRGL